VFILAGATQAEIIVHRRAALAASMFETVAHAQADPLTWCNEGAAKARIVAFVQAVTQPSGTDFVAPSDRIAVFDNDGMPRSEQPMCFQLAFAINRAKAMVGKIPELAKKPAMNAASGDMKALMAMGEKGLVEVVATTHAGTTSEEFAQIVRDWAKTAQHPTLKRPYTQLTFVPMRELLDYLRANGFKTYIVSGGGIEFVRVFSEELYGVPPEQVVGSTIKTKYEVRNGEPVIVRLPQIDFIDD
jgi:haloacid dehalogenase-like hydrolase